MLTYIKFYDNHVVSKFINIDKITSEIMNTMNNV